MSTAAQRLVQVPSSNPLGDCPAWMYGDFQTTSSAVIVIQEWWGLNQSIKDTGREIGEGAGSVTLVPDLYRGKVAEDRETAGHYAEHLDWTGAIDDIDSCARYLRSQGIKKVGVTGFCMGGALSVGVSALRSSLDAAVPFYGIPKKHLLTYDDKDIKIPIQCHFGSKDQAVGLSSPSDYEAFKQRLEDAKANFEFYIYDAGHAFANKTAALYNKEARDLAFSRMYKFFAEHLSSD